MSTMISILGGVGLLGMTVVTGGLETLAGSALRTRRSFGSTRYDGSTPFAHHARRSAAQLVSGGAWRAN